MSAPIGLTRERVGMELRRGPFKMTFDGTDLASIRRHGTVERALEPGRHTLQLRAGRYSSHEQAFDVTDGEIVTFRCHGPMVWLRYVVSMLKPDLAISLERVYPSRADLGSWPRDLQVRGANGC
jgi:hypothetical protein